jgi:hypothetical protein
MTRSGGPAAATRPRCSRTRWSANRATRLSWWLTSSTARPHAACRAASSNTAISCATSRNVVGSSSTSAPASCASARASRTRCHSPPESSSVMRSANGATPASASPRSTASRSPRVGPAHRPPCGRRPSATYSRTRSGNVGSSRCGTTATRRARSGGGRGLRVDGAPARVQRHAAGREPRAAEQRPHERALAAAVGTGHGREAPRRRLERDAVQGAHLGARVAQRHALEA